MQTTDSTPTPRDPESLAEAVAAARKEMAELDAQVEASNALGMEEWAVHFLGLADLMAREGPWPVQRKLGHRQFDSRMRQLGALARWVGLRAKAAELRKVASELFRVAEQTGAK